VVFEREGLVSAGFNITVKIDGRQYPFWEKPFVENQAVYYIVIFAVPSVILLLIILFICLCICSCYWHNNRNTKTTDQGNDIKNPK